MALVSEQWLRVLLVLIRRWSSELVCLPGLDLWSSSLGGQVQDPILAIL
jgi:hypothetical protein